MNSLRVEAGVSRFPSARRNRQVGARVATRVAFGLAFLLAIFFGLGFAFAGSAGKIAPGVKIDGVDVGGLRPAAAERVLERRAAQLSERSIPVHIGTRTFRISPSQLGVNPDWHAAAEEAVSRGNGFGPFRGFRRLFLRIDGSEVAPVPRASQTSVDAWLAWVARHVDSPRRDAALRLHGLQPVLVPARTGRILDKKNARTRVVAALASFDRKPLTLSFELDPPHVTVGDLAKAQAQAKVALSAPVRLTLGPTHYRIPRWRLAQILTLPSKGATSLKIAGPGADRYVAQLEHTVNKPATDATFAVDGSKVSIVPAVDAHVVDVHTTMKHLLAAALSPTNRVAKIAVVSRPAARTTKDAQAMGITHIVSSYTTYFGGEPNRIHNVQVVAHLIDGALVAPGKTFSFNETTGARTQDKGFEIAPVIINGELQNALGGGVCQVSTTVFNAAYEAGLDITARTNHALYISHYPQGRDATVDYPDLDLRFVNDTGRWLLLRTFVSSSALTVNLYGTPVHRKVVSETSPLVVTGPPPVKKVKDPTLLKGKQVVEVPGSSSLSTSVHRRVYDEHGKLLYDNTWFSNYRGETRVIRVGAKKPPPPPAPVDLSTLTPGALH
jgi:vancomycin resistance protein YoaR